MNVGMKIREERKKRRWSQRKLGLLVGATESTISKWERAEDDLTISTLKSIAVAMSISVARLIQDKEDDDNNPLLLRDNHALKTDYYYGVTDSYDALRKHFSSSTGQFALIIDEENHIDAVCSYGKHSIEPWEGLPSVLTVTNFLDGFPFFKGCWGGPIKMSAAMKDYRKAFCGILDYFETLSKGKDYAVVYGQSVNDVLLSYFPRKHAKGVIKWTSSGLMIEEPKNGRFTCYEIKELPLYYLPSYITQPMGYTLTKRYKEIPEKPDVPDDDWMAGVYHRALDILVSKNIPICKKSVILYHLERFEDLLEAYSESADTTMLLLAGREAVQMEKIEDETY